MRKHKSIFMLSTAALALGMASCGDTSTNTNINVNTSRANSAMNSVSNAASTVANTVANTAATVTTPSPESFMQMAARGGMAEVETGKLAKTKAKNAEVKTYGAMMETDHAKANAELKALAATKNITLPTDLGSHQSTVDQLKGLSGAEFDEAYVDAMVEDHEDTVEAFQTQADRSTDAEVKAFAAKNLPTLKAHLEKIKAIQAKLSGAGANSNSNANANVKR